MEFNPSSTDLEQAHITLAELIANTKILFKATQLAQTTNKELLKTYESLSNKFLDRQKMVGFEMTELLDTLKKLTKTIDDNPDQATNFNKQELSVALLDILNRSGVSDTTRQTISRNYASTLAQASGTAEDQVDLVTYVKTIADQMKTDNRMEKLQAQPALQMAKMAEQKLDQVVHEETRTTLSQLAKKKAGELSEGKMAGGISYIEDLFGVNGATDFVSDKMGEFFGFKNLKEKMLTALGASAKKLYGGIEKFLPDMFKLDERRFYSLNKEIMFNAEQVIAGLDNDISRLMVRRDKDIMRLQHELESGSTTQNQFLKQKDKLDADLDKAKKKLEVKKAKFQKEFDTALISVSDVDLDAIAENLYTTIEKNRAAMEADLADRMDRGIISDAEVAKTRRNFAITESNLKSGLKDAYVKDDNFSLESYIKKTTASSSKQEQELVELNSNFSQFLQMEKDKQRQDELKSDIFEKKDGENKEDSDSAFKNNMKEKLESKDGDSLFDSLGDMMDFGDGGDGRRRRGKRRGRRGRGKLRGARPKSLVGRIANVGRSAVGTVARGGRGLMSVGKGAARLLGKAALPLAALMAAKDGFDGWNNAASNFDLQEGQEATTGQKASSAVGGVVSGLTMGLVDEKKAAQTVHKIGSGIANFFGFGDKKEGEKEEENTGFFGKLKNTAKKAIEYSPMGLINKGINKLFGSSEEKNPEELVAKKKEMAKDDKMIELLEQLVDKNMVVNVSSGGSGGTYTPKHQDDLGIAMVNNGMIQ